MDVNALLAKEGQLTDEELAFLEQHLLTLSRQLVTEVSKITAQVEDEEPELARQLERSAASVLLNVELGIKAGLPEIEH